MPLSNCLILAKYLVATCHLQATLFDVESQHSDPLHYKETGVKLVTIQKNFTIFLAMKGSKKYTLSSIGVGGTRTTLKSLGRGKVKILR